MKELQQEALEIGQGRSMIRRLRQNSLPKSRSQRSPTTTHSTSTTLLINAWAIARDPSNWEKPEEFRPERFLKSSIDYKGFHFELIPFGAGRRGCPGIQFAMVVNELVLANLVFKFDLALVGEEGLDMSETNGITVHKKCPILVSATPRS
ncbi:hypothetical protein L1987_22650 [Smallanthus sonchifolius]|uniref:Uncharacterized protein n=1 Tax=Smallanthus sonchifolius TaxID=185202 RepID=A0ACB9IG18_9ASTR|nr:hypothetical protein L1987_22650 [Smallanthus sonchifolius]